MDNSGLGERLKTARKIAGISQQELADNIGLTRGNISHYELGRSAPDMKTINAMAKVLDVSVGYLLGISEKNEHEDGKSIVDIDDYVNEQVKNIGGLMYSGDVISPEGKEKFFDSLRLISEIVKQEEDKRRRKDG